MFRSMLCCTLVLMLAACTNTAETQGTGAASGDLPPAQKRGTVAAASGDIEIGDPVSHKNLSVFPLYLKDYKEVEEDYITLGEAIQKKSVQVSEKDSSGTVNAVEIGNSSKQPIYILAGQVIIGGKQDRVITKDTIVPPGQKIQVEVCCVEQGRWSPRDGLGATGALEFANAASGNVAGKIKMLAQTKGQVAQGEVWEEVAKQALANEAQTDTSTYKKVLEVTEKAIDEYLAAMKVFEKDLKICGFAVCINGEVESCDIFASPRLLAKFREFQLRSYALDALNAGEAKDAKPTSIASVREFMKEMEEASKETEKLAENKHRRVEKMESDKVIGFDNAAQPAPGKAGMSLHRNVYKKK